MGGISVWQLLILLVIVVLLFGTKKLKNIGKDAGDAVKGFKDAMGDGEKDAAQSQAPSVEHKSSDDNVSKVIEGETDTQKKEAERS